jgi:hypothetical protein
VSRCATANSDYKPPDYRLTGAAKAQVAAKLAVVHLMNRKPVEVVRVIAGSRMPHLPQQLREQRLFVEARALSETGRHDTAFELMENLRGPEADRLRADIHWSAKHWREAGERLEAIVGERWKEEGRWSRRTVTTCCVRRSPIRSGRKKSASRASRTNSSKRWARRPKARSCSCSFRRRAPRTLTEAARALSSFDSLGTFIKRYRERFPEQPLPPDPMPTSLLFKVQRISGR